MVTPLVLQPMPPTRLIAEAGPAVSRAPPTVTAAVRARAAVRRVVPCFILTSSFGWECDGMFAFEVSPAGPCAGQNPDRFRTAASGAGHARRRPVQRVGLRPAAALRRVPPGSACDHGGRGGVVRFVDDRGTLLHVVRD